jgi:hypothetical protein
LERDFAESVAAACQIKGRPFGSREHDSPPDYEGRIDCVVDPTVAAEKILRLVGCAKIAPRPVAFDFETTTLKPDGPHAEIVCCSISDGEDSIAFPWVGKAAKTMTEVIADKSVRKVGWNIRFEDRWCRAKLGTPVRGAVWDGMLAAHALDVRKGSGGKEDRASGTGLKFQTFVNLGVEDYAAAVAPYLKSKGRGGNAPNRVREVPLPDLLTYCAKDSLYEIILAKRQAKLLGVKL